MKTASVVWRLSLAALLLMLAWQVWQLRRAPQWMETQIDRQGSQTRADALAAIAATRRDLLAETNRIRTGLFARADRLLDLSDRDLRSLTARADRQFTAANASIAELAKLRTDIAALLPPVRHTLDVTSENADLLGRCATQDPVTSEWIGNPDCLANRLIPALKSMEHIAAAGEKTAAAVAAVAPRLADATAANAQNIAGITADLHTITARIVKPKSLLGNVWEVLKIATVGAMHVF